MTRARPRRRGALVGGALLAAIAIALLAQPDRTESPRRLPSTTTTLRFDDAFDAAYSQGLIAGSGGLLDDEQAACITAKLVDTVGRDNLVALDPRDPPADERVAVETAYVDCVPPDVLAALAARDDG